MKEREVGETEDKVGGEGLSREKKERERIKILKEK